MADDYVALLQRINDAGYGYVSEWIGDDAARVAKFTLTKGRARPRKVGEFYGADPHMAAVRAALSINVEVLDHA